MPRTIQGARILGGEPANIVIEDGLIAGVGFETVAGAPSSTTGDDSLVEAVIVMDATGLIALPGLVDLHVHVWSGVVAARAAYRRLDAAEFAVAAYPAEQPAAAFHRRGWLLTLARACD